MTSLSDTGNEYIGRAIIRGIRAKKRAPYSAPTHAKLTKAISALYTKTPGAINQPQPGYASRGRNAMFEPRFVLANGTTTSEFTPAWNALQAFQTVRVQLWEWTRLPKSWWQTDDGKNDDGECFMRAESKPIALTASEIKRHAR